MNEAIAQFKLAAKAGYVKARNKLATILKLDGETNGELSAASAGNAVALYNQALRLETGQGGVPINLTQAAKLYRRAADLGHRESQHNLAMMYLEGEGGVPKNPKEAVRLLKLASAAGDALAAYTLGTCYDFGDGIPRDLEQAFKYFKISADAGNVDAMCNLGQFYEQGVLSSVVYWSMSLYIYFFLLMSLDFYHCPWIFIIVLGFLLMSLDFYYCTWICYQQVKVQ